MSYVQVDRTVICFLFIISTPVFAGPVVLPIGSTISLDCPADEVRICELNLSEPGILTVAAYAGDEVDLSLNMADANGITYWDEPWNDDMGGDPGMELMCTYVREPGTYQILVKVTGGDAGVRIGGSWLSYDPAELPRFGLAGPVVPDNAVPLEAGDSRNGRFDRNKDDLCDWYRFTAEDSGRITVTTRGPAGDLLLEAYDSKSLGAGPLVFSDQDIQRNTANEAVTLDVEQGKVYYFMVCCQDFSAVDYTISCYQLDPTVR